jgi:glycosyltransferase involved in cell wall biosynthesis
LLNAFGQLVNQPASAGTQLVFVGKREDDAVYDEAREIDRRLEQDDLKDRVRFLGFQQDDALVLLYQAAAALLLPSFVEGFGLSAVEAARCGTPRPRGRSPGASAGTRPPTPRWRRSKGR